MAVETSPSEKKVQKMFFSPKGTAIKKDFLAAFLIKNLDKKANSNRKKLYMVTLQKWLFYFLFSEGTCLG